MRNVSSFVGVLSFAALAAIAGSCSSSVGYYDPYWDPYYFPWHYSTYGAWTVVHRPAVVVDGWTRSAFNRRPYRGHAVSRRQHSPITYTAVKGDRTYEVVLTERNDSTQVEVRARRGADRWEQQQARELMGRILADYKAERPQ
jgi:hypothetical protein